MKKLILIFVLALSACATAGHKIDWGAARSVQPGMSETEVTRIMGSPYMVSSRGKRQTWIYTYYSSWDGAHGSVTYGLEDGRVVVVPTIPAYYH